MPKQADWEPEIVNSKITIIVRMETNGQITEGQIPSRIRTGVLLPLPAYAMHGDFDRLYNVVRQQHKPKVDKYLEECSK